MSILQELEYIRTEIIGEETYAKIEEYLSEHPELLLSDIYYKEECWNQFEKWLEEKKEINVEQE